MSQDSANRQVRSNPGRPAGGDSDKVRADLIDAARQHFLSRDFKAVSIRQIAASAGVNGAMVNYYFGGKQGLYMAMVDGMLAELEAKLTDLRDDSDISLVDFSNSYCLLLARNPWWPNFMVREVLFSEGKIREAIIEKFGNIIGPRLVGMVQQEITQGHFREELDPRLTIISLLGMTIFPVLARPVLEQVFKLELNETTAAAIAAHNTQLIMTGVMRPDSSGGLS
ncbi:MAG: TetR/AcrR family transcriptional regulator [Gammaproteobacteria bacterium]|nr:TetR/AcrR family transcriptional regulator [Gammaproteobacteria bacterium]